MMDHDYMVVPLERFAWYPKHRVLVTDWNTLKHLGLSMKAFLCVTGQHHSIMFRFEGYDWINDRRHSLYKVYGLDNVPEQYRNIVIWYFYDNNAVDLNVVDPR